MAAQWPTFVNNLSDKLSSRSSNSRDEFSVFLANEYFNAVKKAQTPFGNTHVSGQKTILENGFKDAFKKIYNEETIEFSDKFNMLTFADFFEPLPNTNFDFDPLCEIEEWIKNNQETLTKFKFYQLFKSTCPIYKKLDIYADIDFDIMIEHNESNAKDSIKNAQDGILYATMSISEFTKNINYKFVYDINGDIQPILKANTDGILQVRVNSKPGQYKYTFRHVLDQDDNLIKEINKTATVNIDNNGVLEIVNIIEDPSINKKVRQQVPNLTEDEKIEAIANRILYQSDGSNDFKLWVDRLLTGYNPEFGKKVSKLVFKLCEGYYKSEELKLKNKRDNNDRSKIRDIIPTIEQLGIKNTLNQYILQNEYIDSPESIPDWLIPSDYICKFTYVKEIDAKKPNTKLKNNMTAERSRIESKERLYRNEKELWWLLLRDWANSKKVIVEDLATNVDGYVIMSRAIINYWKSTLQQPFKSTPPIPPCNITAPLNGIYSPISYGNESTLANDLRRAWNTGKSFNKLTLTPIASKAVSSAVSVACAKHLTSLKFLYLGGITSPTGAIPMTGFVPVVI